MSEETQRCQLLAADQNRWCLAKTRSCSGLSKCVSPMQRKHFSQSISPQIHAIIPPEPQQLFVFFPWWLAQSQRVLIENQTSSASKNQKGFSSCFLHL